MGDGFPSRSLAIQGGSTRPGVAAGSHIAKVPVRVGQLTRILYQLFVFDDTYWSCPVQCKSAQ